LWSSLEESALKKRYVVRLSGVEREQLEGLVKRGRWAAYRRRHAQVLLQADEGERGSGANSPTVCMRGLPGGTGAAPTFAVDGEGEARLVSNRL